MKRIEEASGHVQERAQRLEEVYEAFEMSFELIGSTGIEDRLQDGVGKKWLLIYDIGETIKFVREAGIKIWMLTGDKVETAETIGHSSGLLDDEKRMQTIKIVQNDAQGVEQGLEAIESNIKEIKGGQKTSILVSGDALAII